MQVGIPPRHNGASLNRRGFRWNLMADALKVYTWVMLLTPWLLCPGGLYMKLDPFSFTFAKLLTRNQIFEEVGPNVKTFIWVAEFFLRLICSYICTVEACRFFSFFFSFVLLNYESVLKVSTFLNCYVLSANNPESTREFLRVYRWYVIITSVYKNTLEQFVATSMGEGFVIFVIANLVTLTCSQLIPIYVYWLMPMVSVACTFFVHTLLVTVVEICNRNSRAISYLKRNLSENAYVLSSNKIIFRELKLLKPVCLSCGPFYPLVQGSEANYFFYVSIRTVDAILLQLV